MVKFSALTGGEASCEACGWRGTNSQLLGYTFDSGFANPEEILKNFAQDIKMVLVRNGIAIELGRLLLKWGFATKLDPPTLTRYLMAVAQGMASAVLEERRVQEKEQAHVS